MRKAGNESTVELEEQNNLYVPECVTVRASAFERSFTYPLAIRIGFKQDLLCESGLTWVSVNTF